MYSFPAPVLIAGLLLTACVQETPEETPSPSPTPLAGALVGVRVESQVGVLLDEIPEGDIRSKLTADLQDMPRSFWQDRARAQIQLTRWRLYHRPEIQPGRGQLPLPPEESWEVVLTGAPQVKVVDAHDMMVVNYTLTAILLTDVSSPVHTEPSLGQEGGRWIESFQLPVDPISLMERTGYTCINESGLGPGSIDVGNAPFYYDDTCQREVDTSPRCHLSAAPEASCRDELRGRVGHVSADLVFERLAWDPALAESVRISREAPPSADLFPRISGQVPTVYRYFAPDSCAIQDRCVAAAGWRRLLLTDLHLVNAGLSDVWVGDVEALLNDPSSAQPASTLLEVSSCRPDKMVTHAASLLLGEGSTSVSNKWPLCFTSSSRVFNDEMTPLDNPFVRCDNQGVASGWASDHPSGSLCQWLDVTDVTGGAALPMEVVANPDGLMCEGEVLRDTQGQVMWETTTVSNAQGETVHKMKCDYLNRWAEDNGTAGTVVIPEPGEGRITLPCARGEVGPWRSCGFTLQPGIGHCTPGEEVTLELPEQGGQVVRLCEASVNLGAGTSCDAAGALWNGLNMGPLTFLCPPPRENKVLEPGGTFVTYTAPLVPDLGEE